MRPPIARQATCLDLEADPDLALKSPVTGFGGDLPKRIIGIHIEIRSPRRRMVQDVCRVDPKLKALGFADAELFADVGIQRKVSDIANRVYAQRASFSRQWIL